jgi:L-fucose isomerase-like protein
VFSHHRQDAQGKQSEAGWPYLGYDHEARKKELLRRLQQHCPDVEFLPATAYSVEDARQILKDDAAVDGYLAYMIGGWAGAAQTIAAAGRPTLYVGDLYGASGEFLVAYAASRRSGPKVAAVTSSRFEDVAEAVRCFALLKQPGGSVDAFVAACDAARKRSTPAPKPSACTADPLTTIDVGGCLQKLRGSTILAIGTQRSGLVDAIGSVFGTKVLTMDFGELTAACRQADREEAGKWAERWIGEAERVIEPNRATIEKSGAMYVAMRTLMQRHHAQAITINCLGGFYGGHLEAYPCLGYRQLNNDGLVGACEADLLSTATMLALTYLVNRPGFISDPVLDTSTNQVIYAHCVAPSKVFGPQGPANPFHIRSHAEDGLGAAIRSLLPLGYLVSTLQLHPQRNEVIFHQGKSVENVDEPRVCRTKLAAEVRGDIEKLMNYWDQWGWHRVTVYGDLHEPIRQLAQALGMRMVEEA